MICTSCLPSSLVNYTTLLETVMKAWGKKTPVARACMCALLCNADFILR